MATRPRPTIARLQAAGRAMADYLHGNVAECEYCGLAHAHRPDCLVARWLAAGGETLFTQNAARVKLKRGASDE